MGTGERSSASLTPPGHLLSPRPHPHPLSPENTPLHLHLNEISAPGLSTGWGGGCRVLNSGLPFPSFCLPRLALEL